MSHDEKHKLELHELKASRYRIDPIADLAAEAIIHNKDVHHLQKVLMHMATKDQGIPEELPPDAQKYFEVTGKVDFTDEDKARLDRASDIFATYGPMVVMSLIFRSLPTTYMA